MFLSAHPYIYGVETPVISMASDEEAYIETNGNHPESRWRSGPMFAVKTQAVDRPPTGKHLFRSPVVSYSTFRKFGLV